MPNRRTIRLTDAAMRLRVPYQTAHRMLLLGEIEGKRDGRTWAVYADSVEAALRKRAATPTAA
jgi:excisionase family DNA binding protein